MDPLTHILATRKWVGKERRVVLAGLAADAPFYLTYPLWLLRHGRVEQAFRSGQWPRAPRWMYQLHHLFHSLPVVVSMALWLRFRSGYWPREVAAWTLHILIDIPTHSRRNWAPQVLWPLSERTVDGVSWAEWVLDRLRERV